jgi:hypothetical protein
MAYAIESVENVGLVGVREFRKSGSALEHFVIVGNSRDNLTKIVCYFLCRLQLVH